MAEVHEVESCVRGFHVYGDIWTPNVGDLLDCEQESGNLNDAYAVAIKNGVNVIGHVPRKLSAACSLFLCLGGAMSCEITDNHRRYSVDLPQGGLEIPCKFIFSAERPLLCKLRKLVHSVPPIQVEQENALKRRRQSERNSGTIEQSSSIVPATKKVKVEVIDCDDVIVERSSSKPWLKFDKLTLTTADMNMIAKGWFKKICAVSQVFYLSVIIFGVALL